MLAGCTGSEPVEGGLPLTRLRTDLTHLRDAQNRYVMLHGVNLSGSTKVPFTVDGKTIGPKQMADINATGTPSYVGRPFPPRAGCAAGDDTCKWAGADAQWRDVRDAGFNSVRFLVNWEGVEPVEQGKYDLAYLATVRKNVELANKYGIYVLMDMHQDSFSRHLAANYNEYPEKSWSEAKSDAIATTILALMPGPDGKYTDTVRGEGAPRWVIEQCLQEKDLDSPYWGVPRLLSGLNKSETALQPDDPMYDANDPTKTHAQATGELLGKLAGLLAKLLGGGGGGGGLPPWVSYVIDNLSTDAVPVTGTTDLLPFTNWGLMSMTSVDTARAFFCLMALDPVKKVNPGWPTMKALKCTDGTHRPTDFTRCTPDKIVVVTKCDDAGKADPYKTSDCKTTPRELSATEWVQDAYTEMWRQVVRQVKDLPNVLGYDIINEPNSNALVLTADAALLMTGVYEGARDMLVGLLGDENGVLLYDLLGALRLFPPLKPMPKPVAPMACDGLGGAWDPATLTGTGELAKCEATWVVYRADLAGYDKKVADYAPTKAKILKDWGLDKLDTLGVIGLNLGFDKTYIKPFYEKVGTAMLQEDPDAIIWIEPTMSIAMVLGGVTQGMWDQSMPPLELWRCDEPGVKPLDPACPEEARKRVTVYEPHYYADIYPFLGFDAPSRDFAVDEVQYRDYQAGMASSMASSYTSLGNIPAIYGEFGTYYNFGGLAKSQSLDYLVSSSILDNYYEALEKMMTSRLLWCYTPNNDAHYGDLWNKEDFSIRGPAVVDTDGNVVDSGPWRSSIAWARPYARAVAGKPISMHYYSPLHYFDPKKDTPDPVGEFEIRYESRETGAPTEIAIPAPTNSGLVMDEGGRLLTDPAGQPLKGPDPTKFYVQISTPGKPVELKPVVAATPYPDGFYVWLSDGKAFYDPTAHVLYHYPDNDAPDTVHWVRLLPPIEGANNTGWKYFFKGDQVVVGN